MPYNQGKTARKPYIVVFDDDEKQAIAKTVWSLVSGHDVRLEIVKTATELEAIASDAVLIIIVTQGVGDRKNEALAGFLRNPRIVADVIALTPEPSLDARFKTLAMGYDGIFNITTIEGIDLRSILMHRVEKGYVRLENRIMQEEYRRFSAALAASPDAFIIFDENRKIFFVSEHYRRAYPASGEKLLRGLDLFDAFDMCAAEQGVKKGDPRYDFMRAFWERMDGETEFSTEDGRIWHVKAKSLPAGQGSIVTTTDITRFRAQQAELEQKSVALAEVLRKEQEASALQKQFIDMVSHEFRTPLTIIDGHVQLMLRAGQDIDAGAIQRRARTIRSAVSRLVNMMEGVLSSNMLRSGRLELRSEPLDLAALITDLCREYTDLSPHLSITCETQDLPVQINLDRKLMILILSNLLSNAIKFSIDDPRITIRGGIDGDRIMLSIEDNGVGIGAEDINHIFDRYFRAESAKDTPGTGIGLALVRDLVDLCGGTIAVHSATGQGTRFEILLPAGL